MGESGSGNGTTGAAIQVGGGKIPPQIAEVYFNKLGEKPEFMEAFNAFMEGKELTPEQQEIVAKNMGIKGAAATKAEAPKVEAAPAEAQPMEIDVEFLKRIPLQDFLDIGLERLQHAVHDQFPKGVLLAIFVSRKKIQVAPAMMSTEDGLKLDDKAGASAVPDAGGQAIERVLKKVITLARGAEEEPEEDDEDDE